MAQLVRAPALMRWEVSGSSPLGVANAFLTGNVVTFASH